MSCMARKKPPRPPEGPSGREEDRHKSATLVRLAGDVAGALKQLAEEEDRPLTRVVRQAMIEFLRGRGKWPPRGSST